MNNDIIFQTIKSTRTGEGASTGKQTEIAFNQNFALAKRLFDELISIASMSVVSEQVTQVKLDTSTRPYLIYYSIDPITDPNPTWIPAANTSFSSIIGVPTDNIALKTLLDSKGSATDVEILKTQMSGATSDIIALQNQQEINTTNIATNTSSITDIQATLLDTVRTQHGDTLYIRYVQQTNTLEYSLDGVTYTDISALGTDFGSITGNVTDNATLVNYISNQIAIAIADATATYALAADLQAHVTNVNNPHGITKAQIGLGDVENYSLATMPIPASVQQALNDIYQGTVPLVPISPADYRALPSPSSDSLYLTNSIY